MSKELSLSTLEIEKHLKDFVFELEMGKVDEMFISNSFEIIEKALKEGESIKKIVVDELVDLETTRKKLKALEIIKNKQVNVFVLLHCGDLETYNDMIADNRNLTQEEYDILKEVLL